MRKKSEMTMLTNWAARVKTLKTRLVSDPVSLQNVSLMHNTISPLINVPVSTKLPLIYHYGLLRNPTNSVSADGYLLDFAPTLPNSKRMWAGSKFLFKKPIEILNQTLVETCSVKDVIVKEKKDGCIVFVVEERVC